MAANPFKLSVGQIRDRRRSVQHNVRGIRGLAVQIDGAEQTMRALAQLPAAAQRRVLRQGLAAAARPVRAAMKAGAAAYERGSAESIGAVGRSLGVKVASSKKNPAIAYAMVGALRGYAETVTLNKVGEVQSLRVRRFRGRKVNGVQKVGSRQLKNIGPTARKARLDPRNGLIQRRKPTRYLHLIELGPRGRIKRAGNFMDKAARSAASASMQAFDRVFSAGLHREFQKMAAK
jgi:hypothetical protein